MGRRRTKKPNNKEVFIHFIFLIGLLTFFNPSLGITVIGFLIVIVSAIYLISIIFKTLLSDEKEAINSGQIDIEPLEKNKIKRLGNKVDTSQYERDLYEYYKESKKTPSSEKEKVEEWSIHFIKSIEWKCFEDLCAEVFKKIGFNVKSTELGADGGIDLILFKNEQKPYAIVQCKSWDTYKVGVKPIRELYGVMHSEEVSNAYFVTTSEFTNEAQEFAEDKKLQLVNGKQLLEKILSFSKEDQEDLLNLFLKMDYKTPSCPSCGRKMVVRTTKKGKNYGNQFWGCSAFPNCYGKLKLRKSDC